MIWLSDADGRFIAPQPTWSAFTGQDWEAHRDSGWLSAVHPEDREALVSRLRQAREEFSLFSAQGRLWSARHASYRWCEARGMPVLGLDGQVIEWVGTFRDIDDKVRAEQALQQADRRKDEFMVTLAHELRNPLAPIRNVVHVLNKRRKVDLQLTWALEVIDRQIAQASRLLDDLMDVSRIKEGKVQLLKSRISLDEALQDALEESRPAIEQHGHQLELNVLSGPVYLDADRARLVQVFSNLLNNAAKYTDRGGRISLTVSRSADWVVVSVKDSGVGIAGDMLTRIFDVFTQAESPVKHTQTGLGIGLALVRSLVELHGGQVEARSEGLGRGSEFIVRLPVLARKSEAPDAAAGPRSAVVLRVLVADDNVDAAETLAVLIRLSGHEATVVSDGQEAVDRAAEFIPDVGLIDLALPKLDGYEVARQLRASHPDILLVAVSGTPESRNGFRTASAGFKRHLLKPVNPVKIAELLEQFVREPGNGE
jgi:two-component system CheB/CheR fusion protein